MKQFGIYHSSKGYRIVDEMTGKVRKVFKNRGPKTLLIAKAYAKKKTLSGKKLARKMKRLGWDESDIVQETGYNL